MALDEEEEQRCRLKRWRKRHYPERNIDHDGDVADSSGCRRPRDMTKRMSDDRRFMSARGIYGWDGMG